MSGLRWVVFEAGGERLAFPASEVERVLPQPRLVRLPGAAAEGGGGQQGGVTTAVHVGADIIPLVGQRETAGGEDQGGVVLVLAAAGGRLALHVERVLGVGGLGEGGRWAEGTVRCLTAEAVLPPAVVAPGVAAGRRLARRRPAAEAATTARRMLRVRAAGADWALDVRELVGVHAQAALVPVPGGAAPLLGAAILRGQAVPVLAVLPGDGDGTGRATDVVVMRCAEGVVGFAVEQILGWGAAAATDRLLAPGGLRAAAGLAVVPPEREGAAGGDWGEMRRFLPVVVGGQPYVVPLERVERVRPRIAAVRLPVVAVPRALLGASPGALPGAGGGSLGPDGAVAVDGRVVPLSDARRWLGRASGAETVHLLVRMGGAVQALAVDSVGRPMAVAASRVSPVCDPARHVAAIARLAEGPVAVLDLDALHEGSNRGRP